MTDQVFETVGRENDQNETVRAILETPADELPEPYVEPMSAAAFFCFWVAAIAFCIAVLSGVVSTIAWVFK